MSVRVLGGHAKGFTVLTPKSNATRPTSVMLKRRLFDSFQNLNKYHFLDICAGSGSIGLEALSRGAESCSFIESNSRSFGVLKGNVRSFRDKYPELGEAYYHREDFVRYLKKHKEELLSSDMELLFLYFDPPYEDLESYKAFFRFVSECGDRLNAVIAVEACSQKTLSIESFEENFGKCSRVYKQGTNYLGIYQFVKTE